MQWNFEDNRPDRLMMGSAYDIALFFVAVVLLFVVAVMPDTSLASGAAPGEPIFWSSLYLSAPIGLLWLGVFLHRRLALRKQKGGAMTEELTALYSLINGLVVILIGGWLIYGAMNAYFDKGERHVHYVYVHDKKIADDGRYEVYRLLLSDWNRDGAVIALEVTSDLYDMVYKEQSCLRLTTRPGAFGHEWIETNEPFKWSDVDIRKDWAYQCRALWEGQTQLVESGSDGTERWR